MINPEARIYYAIVKSIEFGKVIQEKIPEVAIDFRSGKSLTEIVSERKIGHLFGLSPNVSRRSLRYALSGYYGDFSPSSFDSYSGLLSSEEIEEIVKQHRTNSGRVNGKLAAKNGNLNQRRAAFARGATPWRNWVVGENYCVYSEKQYAFDLSKLEKYQRQGQQFHSNTKIAQRLNEVYHHGKQIRTENAVGCVLKRMREN